MATGHKKLIIVGLYVEICVAMPTHQTARRRPCGRMVQGGAVPLT